MHHPVPSRFNPFHKEDFSYAVSNPAQAHAQIDRAVDAGINFIDTSEIYPVPPKADTQGLTGRVCNVCRQITLTSISFTGRIDRYSNTRTQWATREYAELAMIDTKYRMTMV